MRSFIRFCLTAIGIAVGLNIAWRFATRRWELPCPSWLIWFLENPITEAFASSRRILDRLDLKPGMRVLDIGAGPGRLSIPAALRVSPEGNVVALDIQGSMLSILEGRALRAGLRNVKTVHGRLEPGVLEEAAFDRALMVLVLGEIPNRDLALRVAYAALKPGGVLSVTEMLPDPHFQTQGMVKKLAEACGFQVGRVWGNTFAYTVHLLKPAHV